MPLIKSIHTKKILRMTKQREERIKNNYLGMKPEGLANHFYMSSESEQLLIAEALATAPEDYRKKVEYYSKHPIELKEALLKSGLEEKSR